MKAIKSPGNNRDIPEELQAIPKDRVKVPRSIPVSVYIQEAENLYQWSLKDKEILKSKGLDESLIEELPRRNKILLRAEANWTTARNTREGDRKRRQEELPAAFKLRDELLSHFRFAFRKTPGLMNVLKSIGRSTKNAGMFQNLNDLSVLGKNNPEPLAAIGFDMDLLDKAAKISAELPLVLANISAEKESLKDVRDRAYTYLKLAVDEVRDAGKYAFRNDKKRLKGYKSEYLAKRKARFYQKQ